MNEDIDNEMRLEVPARNDEHLADPLSRELASAGLATSLKCAVAT